MTEGKADAAQFFLLTVAVPAHEFREIDFLLVFRSHG